MTFRNDARPNFAMVHLPVLPQVQTLIEFQSHESVSRRRQLSLMGVLFISHVRLFVCSCFCGIPNLSVGLPRLVGSTKINSL